jgi:hypothetical protein
MRLERAPERSAAGDSPVGRRSSFVKGRMADSRPFLPFGPRASLLRSGHPARRHEWLGWVDLRRSAFEPRCAEQAIQFAAGSGRKPNGGFEQSKLPKRTWRPAIFGAAAGPDSCILKTASYSESHRALSMSDSTPSKDPRKIFDTSRMDFARARQQYGWAWFDFHARQRTTVFNFFLVAETLVLNAYAQLIKDNWTLAAAIVALAGALGAFGFLCLEYRNRQLVRWGERALEQSERNFLFAHIEANGFVEIEIKGELPGWNDRGILSMETDAKDGKIENFREDGVYLLQDDKWKYEFKILENTKCERKFIIPISHGIWLPRLIIGAIALFAVLFLVALVPGLHPQANVLQR